MCGVRAARLGGFAGSRPTPTMLPCWASPWSSRSLANLWVRMSLQFPNLCPTNACWGWKLYEIPRFLAAVVRGTVWLHRRKLGGREASCTCLLSPWDTHLCMNPCCCSITPQLQTFVLMEFHIFCRRKQATCAGVFSAPSARCRMLQMPVALNPGSSL